MPPRFLKFENGDPICFHLLPSLTWGSLAQEITNHGGKVTALVHADFVIGRKDMKGKWTVELPNEFVDESWIRQSLLPRHILPIYPYLHTSHASGNRLGKLHVDDRDIAELVKVLLDTNSVDTYGTLQRKFPHNTSSQWEKIHRAKIVRLEDAMKTIKLELEQQLDRSLLGLLGEGIDALDNTDGDSASDSRDSSVLEVIEITPKPKAKQYTTARGYFPVTNEDIQAIAAFLVRCRRANPELNIEAPGTKFWVDFMQHYDRQNRRTMNAWRCLYSSRKKAIMKLVRSNSTPDL